MRRGSRSGVLGGVCDHGGWEGGLRGGGCGYIDLGSAVSEVCAWASLEGRVLTDGSEISPAKDRGRFVTMNHIGFVVGLAVGLW